MSKKALGKRLKSYREELGRQFAKKYKLTIGCPTSCLEAEVSALYQRSYNQIREDIKKMTPQTLGRIIAVSPEPAENNTVPLLFPRANQDSLESQTSLGVSGRIYLEALAHCALVGAIYDYLFAQAGPPNLQTATLISYHNSSSHTELLANDGSCKTCGISPDIQETSIHYHCPRCNRELAGMICLSCGKLFRKV